MLGRILDDRYEAEVRRRVPTLAISRLIATSAFRFTPPFLATIARGLDVSLADIGLALAISELSGLLNPFLGGTIDRLPRHRTMFLSLMVIAASTALAALSPNRWLFAIGISGISLANATNVIAINGWVADRVPYAERSRVIGVVEFSWAGALLITVPIMGLVTALSSWRWGLGTASAACFVAAFVLSRKFADADGGRPTEKMAGRLPAGWWRSTVRPVVASGMLMAAAQCAFVTFGSWLEDDFGFTAGRLSAVAFGLGLGELTASASTVRFTDRLGKSNAMMLGMALMASMGLLLATPLHEVFWIGFPLLIVFLLGFEFGIVSSIPIGAHLVEGRPSVGMGLTFGAGTVGRASMSLVAAWLYDHHGFTWPMLLAACWAMIATSLMWQERHRLA